MNWKDVAGKIVGAAPMLGGLLGGPLGGAAGGIISMLGGVLGLEPNEVTPARVGSFLKHDPDALLKLKELEYTHRVKLQELVLVSEAAKLADTASARTREIEITKATGKRDYNLYILAWVVVSGFFGLCAMLFFKTIPPESGPIVYTLFGGLVSGFSTVLGYFFGSSRSSKDKTALLASKF